MASTVPSMKNPASTILSVLGMLFGASMKVRLLFSLDENSGKWSGALHGGTTLALSAEKRTGLPRIEEGERVLC